MSLIRQSLWAAVAAVTLAASRFAVTAILARRLSVPEFGQFAYGQWLVDLAFLVCSLGVTGVAGRYLAEYRHDAGRSSAVVRLWRPFAFGLPVLAAVVALLAAWIVGLRLDAFAVASMMAWAVANGLWAMQTAALTGLQRFDLICVANAIAAVMMIVGTLTIPMDAVAPGPVFAVMAVSAGAAALVGLRQTAILARRAPTRIDPGMLRDIRRYAFNIWMTALLWSLVWSRGEMPVVHAYLGDDGVARYAAVLTLFGGAIQGVMLAVSGVGPHLTQLWGEGSRSHAIALARRIMDMQLIACGVAALLLICFGRELLFLGFGSAYREESGTLVILSLGILGMATSSQGHLLQIVTNAQFNRDSTLLGAVLLFILAVWLVAADGLRGAAMARTVTMMLVATASLLVSRVRWGEHSWSKWNVVSTLVLVASCAAIVLWQTAMAWPARAALACVVAVLMALAVRDAEGQVHVRVIISRVSRSWASKASQARKAP